MASYNFNCPCGSSCSVSFSDKDFVSIQGKPMMDWLKVHEKCKQKKEFYKFPIKRK